MNKQVCSRFNILWCDDYNIIANPQIFGIIREGGEE